MDKYCLNIDSIHGDVTVNITRKTIKNIHLKVCDNLQVNLSIPNNVDDTLIEKILLSKKIWIAKQLAKYKQSQGFNTLIDVKNGTSTQYLGKDLRILKKQSPKDYIEIDEKTMFVYLKDVDDNEKFSKIIYAFWREQAELIFQRELDLLYDKIFKKYGIKKPTLHIRKMKTLWGSCTQSKNKITLNEYLLKADLQGIQYVILHELTHLMYRNHNKEFYTFLTIQMPDWKTRKERLDKDVVQGL